MTLETRQLRALAAVVDEGTFTDAAIVLGVSQATVSRTVASLEATLGARVLERGAGEVRLTAVGARVLPLARRVLADVAAIGRVLAQVPADFRVGWAWGAMGARTVPLQQRWAQEVPGSRLVFVRAPGATAGLEDGTADAAVVRWDVDERYDAAVVGQERRVAALPADDPLGRGTSVSLADLAGRTVAIDDVTGSTTVDLWSRAARPAVLRGVVGVDRWLDTIVAGAAVGLTSQATAEQHPRPGVVYLPVADAPPLDVRVAWPREAPRAGTEELVRLATEVHASTFT